MNRTFTSPVWPFLALLLLATSLVVGPTMAGTFTITLDNVTVSACEEVWYEAGLPLWFTATTDDDYTPGFCFFVADANNFDREGIYVYPGRLALDLRGIEGLESVEVDIYETHFAGSTRARLYRDGVEIDYAPSYQEDAQTLTLLNQDADTFVISAQESYVWEIRLIGADILPNEVASFSTLKATYR